MNIGKRNIQKTEYFVQAPRVGRLSEYLKGNLMVTRQKVERLTKAEQAAHTVYVEAHEQANKARKEYAHIQLKERGIKFNKTRVYVTNFNKKEVLAIVQNISETGNVICFEVDVTGRQLSNFQAACCSVDDLSFLSMAQRKILKNLDKRKLKN